MPTIHLLISGKVQGVYYRVSALEKAQQLQIGGWVKNTPQGDVELVATGTQEGLDELIAWCKQGPERAVVTNVVITVLSKQDFDGFHICRS